MTRIGNFLSAGICAVAFSGCYSIRQAYHHNNLFNSRRSVDDVMADASASPKLKERLTLTKSIMAFARSQGLNTDGAYEYYVATGGRAVSYLVQAAPATELKLKRWWFPFVGSVPYLGFYDQKERDALATELVAEGWDVERSTVGAFSSLGWFEDPLYEPMLERDAASLAHLLLHELIHRSFWSPGSVRFNENLAEFGAVALTTRYLNAHSSPATLQGYLEGLTDQKQFRLWLVALKEKLSALYENRDMSRQEMLKRKSEVFSRAQQDVALFRTERYRRAVQVERNNASVMGAALYSPDYDRFEKAYRCSGEPIIGDFLARVEEASEENDDPFAALDSLCR